MRKIVVHMGLSLDGFFEGPDRDLSWHRVDEELHAHFNEELATRSAFIEGRVTYELMEAVWPTADENPEFPPTMREFAAIWRPFRRSSSPARFRRSARTPHSGPRWIPTRSAPSSSSRAAT